MIDFRQLVKAGVQFGHQTSRWCPKMKKYIWGQKNKTHIINVAETAMEMKKAADFLQSVAADGRQVLWVGTKRPAQEAIMSVAESLEHPYVTHRWIGGTLSNQNEIRKARKKLKNLEEIIKKSEKFPYYTKKEINTYKKMAGRLDKNIGGIVNLTYPVGAVVLVDVTKEYSALCEAITMDIPIVALVDTNGDPSDVDYVIPTNDDHTEPIKVILNYLAKAVKAGQTAAQEKAKEEEAATAKKAVAKKTESKTADKETKKEKPASKTSKTAKASSTETTTKTSDTKTQKTATKKTTTSTAKKSSTKKTTKK